MKHMIFGIAVIVVGIVLLLQNLGIISTGAWQIIWPLLIVLLGVSIIFKHKGCCCKDKE